MDIFLSGNGKHWQISFGQSKIQCYIKHIEKKPPEKPKVLLLGPKGLSTMHIGVTTIHFGIGIKPGTTLLGLNNKSKAVLRNKLSEVKFFVKYELSMVLIDL